MRFRHLLTAPALMAAAIMLTSTGATSETRQLQAHAHGHGTMNLALDGGKLTIELEIPGVDIVGFEHMAATAAEKAAVRKARGLLSNPTRIFTLPEAAACRPGPVNVTSKEEHDEDHDKDHKDGEQHQSHEDEHKDEHKDKHKDEHMAFEADYELTCAHPEALSSIRLDLFSSFSSLKEMTVQAIMPKGPVRASATPHNRTVKF